MIVVAAPASDTDPVCPMSEQELNGVILKSKPTTCSVDLIPASLLLDCCDQPILSHIVTDNLLSDSFPSVFQNAILKQLVEKAILDCNNLKNYCAVSNHSFLSKVIKKIVLLQLLAYLTCSAFPSLLTAHVTALTRLYSK